MQTQNTSLALSAKAERQKKFLLFSPVVAFPLFTFLLWSLGVIASVKAVAQNGQQQKGFNMNLPDAKLKEDKAWSKLSFYEQADKDSAKWKAQAKADPYYHLPDGRPTIDTPISNGAVGSGSRLSYDPSPYGLPGYKDEKEAKVYRKIEQLNKQLEQSAKSNEAGTVPVKDEFKQPPVAGMASADIDRLENMMQAMGQGKEEDPEIGQLNGMLERILDIQHPERVQEKIRKTSIEHKAQVFPVTVEQKQAISILEPALSVEVATDTTGRTDSVLYAIKAAVPGNGFYSLDDNITGDADAQNAIEAVVHTTQTIVSGATVKLRLLNDVYINGVLIPAGNFVYGTASLSGERLEVNIKTISYHNNILPVALSVYDVDGMAGMYMPGAITRDVAKQSADQSLQGIGLASLDPSLAAQATSAGIDAAKSLISKKVKLVKVTVKAGYRVLLRDNNNK